MKIQLLIYLLCFVAVASVSLRAETDSPLFGGTADGVFEVVITDQPMPDLKKISKKATQFCEKPNCPKLQNTSIQASAISVQP